MEKHRPLGVRDAGRKTTQGISKVHHRPGHHRRSRDLDLRPHKDPSKTEARPDHPPAKLPRESLGNLPNGDDDYVRRWLAQIESDTSQDQALVTRETSSHRERKKAAHAELPSRRTPLESANASELSRGKRKHDLSSDSSLLEVPIRPQSHLSRRGGPKTGLWQPENQSTPTRKKQKIASSDSGLTSQPAVPEAPKEFFEKRARHKTREDRYEPKKKEEKQRKNSDEKPTRKMREKRGDRKKDAKKSGEELIQNFSSKSISRDRLTLRPSQGLGLFGNGRASSPARRRGVPDLAFSEMYFLQCSRTHQHIDTGHKVQSRSRDREKKNASKAQDEISSFFKPSRAPLQEISSNQDGPSFSPAKKESTTYFKQLESEENTRRFRRPGPPEPNPETDGRIGAGRSSSDRYYLGHSYNTSPSISRSTNPPGSTSRVSGKATTYASWSNSLRSPALTSLRGNSDRTPSSVTPDSIRRSIERTGIFRDTGIKKSSDRCWGSASPGRHEGQAQRTHKTRDGITTDRKLTEMSSVSEAERYEVYSQDGDKAPREFSPGDARGEPSGLLNKLLTTNQLGTIGQHGTSRKRIVIEHFDPTIGWRENSNAIDQSRQTSAAAMRDDKSQPSNPTLLSREQIAKNARIKMPKRLSTTDPVPRNTETGNHRSNKADWQYRKSIPEVNSQSHTKEDSLPTDIPSSHTNSVERPLMSRASNPSLPTIYEDSHEYSPSHGEAIMPATQQGPKNSSKASQPRLSSSQNNNQNRLGYQFRQQDQAGNQVMHAMNQIDVESMSNEASLGFCKSGAWLGNSIGGTTAGPAKLLPAVGVESLYLRQMQQQSPFPQLLHETPTHAIVEPSWEASGAELPTHDGYREYRDQQPAAEYAEFAHNLDHNNDPGENEGYEGGIDNLDAENYNQLGIWSYEIHDIDPNMGNNNLIEDHNHYYENAEAYEGHDCPAPQHFLYPDIEYGSYDTQADTHLNNRFWQPHRRY